MTTEQMSLAIRRLWLGITNVGFWTLTAAAGLYWLSNCDTRGLGMSTLVSVFVAAVAVQGVFDFIGGVTFMPEPRPAVKNFLRVWSRGVVGHTLVLAAIGSVGALSLRLTGGFGVGIVLAMLGLAFGRRRLLHAIGGVTTKELAHDGDTILKAVVNDPAFTGGIVGLGRSGRSLLPGSWITKLPKPEVTVELRRRRWQIANLMTARAFELILIWNLLGTFTGTQALHPADQPLAVALLGHACWMTLWTFASLLVLPALSRKAVFAADRAAADLGQDPRAWITRFPDLVGEDGSANAAVQTIFYPVPAAAMRLRQLNHPTTGFVCGNLARSNLYYSWATFTLLGRTVHCNVGRPALWVFPPSA